MGSGVAGAIKRRGGISIEREAVSKGPIPVGTAVVTGAGDLPSKHVIHAAVMGQDLRTDLPTVAATTRSILRLAEELALESVAIPLLGTGVGGLDVRKVAIAMAGEVVDAASEGGCGGMRVLLVAYDEGAARTVREVVADLA
jgi:O-acetyl-ADP-ribose deacetylase (regulator of RNase III)